MLNIPDKNRAYAIFEDAIINNVNDNPVFTVDTWILHSCLVAETASKIASLTPDMDAKAAYILGLLHDVGKKWSEENGDTFHGISGYHYLKSMGYDDSARVCLTHSFLSYPIDADNYSYNPQLLATTNELLRGYIYDDYDRLIQLCDWLNKGGRYYTLEHRAQDIIKSYPVNAAKVLKNYEGAKSLKAYFDYKVNRDIYKFLGIK